MGGGQGNPRNGNTAEEMVRATTNCLIAQSFKFYMQTIPDNQWPDEIKAMEELLV